jgi:Inner membrane component of T3SS, cytoplasmic domain/Inner membrane component of T3SS, periplasmic domain
VTAPTAPRPESPTAPRPESKRSDAAMRQAGAKLKFEVVAGTHQGAVVMLDRADYRIGSSPHADIVLSDSGVAAEHAVLRIERSTVRIDATGAAVRVERELLPVSRGRRVRLPVSFTLGAARIHLSGSIGDTPAQRLGELSRWVIGKPFTATGVLACFVLAITVVAQGLPRKPRTDPAGTTFSEAAGLEHLTSGQVQGPSTASPESQLASTAEEAAYKLKARLSDANIQTLRVSVVDGRLAVAGKVSKQDASAWGEIQQWFDQTYGGRLVLATEVSPASEVRSLPALHLQAISYGEHPYIVTGDGERYYEGAVLDNGWILREIGEDRLLLTKEGEQVAVPYR